MAIPTKGARRVLVEGAEYTRLIRKKPTYLQGAFETSMRVAIQRSGAPGVLLVDLRVSRPDNWIEPHQTALKPAMVREIITAALAEGWDPEQTGSAFEFTYGLIKHKP